jgi:hypothetical protein
MLERQDGTGTSPLYFRRGVRDVSYFITKDRIFRAVMCFGAEGSCDTYIYTYIHTYLPTYIHIYINELTILMHALFQQQRDLRAR